MSEQDVRYEALVAIAYPLILPAIAVLQVRHVAARRSGAVLATIAGSAAVTLGAVSGLDPGLRLAFFLVLGMWWWVVGKMWLETGMLARSFGLLTAVLGAAAIAAALIPLVAGAGEMPVWNVAHVVLGMWMVGLAAMLGRTAAVPSA